MKFRTLLVLASIGMMVTAGCDAGALIVAAEVPVQAPVASVDVDPSAGSMGVMGALQLTATPRDSIGNPLPGRVATWSSSDPNAATVDSSGLVSATAEGRITVSATFDGVSGAATITVAGTAEGSLTIATPDTLYGAGDTLTLTVEARDVFGNLVSDPDVEWRSQDTTIATVDTMGTVTAKALGTVMIAASAAYYSSDFEEISVADAPTESMGLADECSSPEAAWVWCDDFDQDRLSSYFEYSDAGGSFTRTADVGVDGSAGMRVQFGQDQVDAGSMKVAFGATPDAYFDPVDAGTNNYRDIYWRIYVRNEAGWTGGGGEKLSRATIFADASWSQAMIAHVWSGGPNENYLVVDPASGTDEQGTLQTTGYNDFANLRWLRASTGSAPLFDSGNVGKWHCVEAHARLNDAGQSNGVFELWVDGQLDAQSTGLNWVGDYDMYGINVVMLENYWNDGSPQEQERYLDNFVVSTERIGC